MTDFAAEVDSAALWPTLDRSAPGAVPAALPVSQAHGAPTADRLQLLRMLLRSEEERLQVWAMSMISLPVMSSILSNDVYDKKEGLAF